MTVNGKRMRTFEFFLSVCDVIYAVLLECRVERGLHVPAALHGNDLGNLIRHLTPVGHKHLRLNTAEVAGHLPVHLLRTAPIAGEALRARDSLRAVPLRQPSFFRCGTNPQQPYEENTDTGPTLLFR